LKEIISSKTTGERKLRRLGGGHWTFRRGVKVIHAGGAEEPSSMINRKGRGGTAKRSMGGKRGKWNDGTVWSFF